MKAAQILWIENHPKTKIHEYCPYCNGKCEFSTGTPSPPIRMDSQSIDIAKKALANAVYYFLLRCFKSNIIDLETLEENLNKFDISIDPMDIQVNR